jgi:hypothetical protein
MSEINEDQYHKGLDKLWDALEFDTYQGGADVFTLAANEIRKYKWLLTQFAEGNIRIVAGIYIAKYNGKTYMFQGFELDAFVTSRLKKLT